MRSVGRCFILFNFFVFSYFLTAPARHQPSSLFKLIRASWLSLTFGLLLFSFSSRRCQTVTGKMFTGPDSGSDTNGLIKPAHTLSRPSVELIVIISSLDGKKKIGTYARMCGCRSTWQPQHRHVLSTWPTLCTSLTSAVRKYHSQLVYSLFITKWTVYTYNKHISSIMCLTCCFLLPGCCYFVQSVMAPFFYFAICVWWWHNPKTRGGMTEGGGDCHSYYTTKNVKTFWAVPVMELSWALRALGGWAGCWMRKKKFRPIITVSTIKFNKSSSSPPLPLLFGKSSWSGWIHADVPAWMHANWQQIFPFRYCVDV